MKLLCSLPLLCLAASTANAGASLTTVGGHPGLAESDYRLSITMDGTLAVVTAEQTVVNRGDQSRELLYTFDLPGDAAITSLTVQLADGRKTRGIVVDANAATQLAPDAAAIDGAPDVALLRMVQQRETLAASDRAPATTYELRVFPVAGRQAVVVTTTWVAPLHFDDGRLSLRIPGRGTDANLLRERVTIAARAPAGATAVGPLYAGGKQVHKGVGKTGRFELTAPADGDLVVESMPRFPRRPAAALVSYATAPIDGTRGVLAVSVMAPSPATSELPHYDRIVLVVDVSRSMGTEGLAAANTLAQAVLDAADHTAQVELILYDRSAHRALGSLKPNDASTRTAIERHITSAPLQNGSHLALALDELRELFATLPEVGTRHRPGARVGATPRTLVAIITDGMTPLSLTTDRALFRAGSRALSEAELLAITLVPDGAPVPDTATGPLAALARRTAGRSIAVRVSAAHQRAASLTKEMTLPPPIELLGLELTSKGTELAGAELPSRLEVGRGAFALVEYHGARPRGVRLTGMVSGESIAITAQRHRGLERSAAALWLSRVSISELVPLGERLADANSPDDYDNQTRTAARRSLLAAARRAGTVTRYTAQVALDPRGSLGKDRAAFADKHGGLFFRIPPPPERESSHSFRELRVDVVRAGTRGHASQRRATGRLDGTILIRLMRTHVLPKANACYQRILGTDGTAHGQLLVVVEIARGEVQSAHIEGSTLGRPELHQCVLAAAYKIQAPRVAHGSDSETVEVARYPITFRVVNDRGEVVHGAPRAEQPDVADPLGGIE